MTGLLLNILTLEMHHDGFEDDDDDDNNDDVIDAYDEEEEEEDDDDEDADGEADEQQNRDVDYLTLPSPANNHAGLVSDEDMELDLVAELEQALQETTEGAGNDESDESEEE
jgi:hypothetical protein